MDRVKRAISQWRAAIGEAHVLTDAAALDGYAQNVSGLSRAVPAVIRPDSAEAVRQIVQIAHACRAPLYPISRGKNWGMGSKLPVQDGTSILDLSRMNRIREINAEHHYAVVEPGVTQGQLHEALCEQGDSMAFNVTGSGLDTSLIGNALERGVGYFASRAEALSGLEVVLGNGDILKTGTGHMAGSAITHLYKYGLGPYMDGLFAQSNYGVVTAAGIELMPAAEAHMAMVAKIDNEDRLARFVQVLTELRKREIIRTAVHIGNRNRTVSTLGPLVYAQLPTTLERDERRAQAEALIAAEGFGPWSAVGGIRGTTAELRAIRSRIRSALKGLASVVFIDDAKIATARRLTDRLGGLSFFKRKRMMLDAIEPLYGLSKGIPTDEPLKSTWWLVGEEPPDGELDPDHSRSGFLYCLPMIPMSGADASAAVSLTRNIYGKYDFVPYVTLNMVNTKVLEGVINLAFDRTDARRVEDAQRCTEELQTQFVERGYIPYRLGIQSMSGLLDEADTFWKTARDLKQVFDPHHIIAPGRYNLV